MRKFKQIVSQFHRDEQGAELMEWAILVVIFAMLAVTAFVIADRMNNKITDAANKLDNITLP